MPKKTGPKFRKITAGEFSRLKKIIENTPEKKRTYSNLSRFLGRDYRTIRFIAESKTFEDYKNLNKQLTAKRKAKQPRGFYWPGKDKFFKENEKQTPVVKKNEAPDIPTPQPTLFPGIVEKVKLTEKKVSLNEFLTIFVTYLPKYLGVLSDIKKELKKMNEVEIIEGK